VFAAPSGGAVGSAADPRVTEEANVVQTKYKKTERRQFLEGVRGENWTIF
jgi:hypothetical protein